MKPKYFAVKLNPVNPPYGWHIAEATDLGKKIPLGYHLYINFEEYEKLLKRIKELEK